MNIEKMDAHGLGRLRRIVLLGSIVLFAGCGGDEKTAPPLAPDTNLDFGQAVQGKRIEYAFTIRGDTAKDLRILRVRSCDLCEVAAIDSVVPRGGAAKVRLVLDTKNLRGPVDRTARVYFTDSTRRPVPLRFKGTVVWPVEFTPQNHAYFFTVKGERAQQEIVLQNNEPQPLGILSVASSNPVFLPTVQTLEEGRRYKLIITLDTVVPPGKHDARITLATNNPNYPALPITAFAQVRNTVAVAPSKVDYGLTAFTGINRVAVRSREVRVIKTGSKDFIVTRATVDLPFIDVEIRPQTRGESSIVTVRIDPKRAKKGEFKGTLLIETNDPQFLSFAFQFREAGLTVSVRLLSDKRESVPSAGGRSSRPYPNVRSGPGSPASLALRNKAVSISKTVAFG